MVPVGPYIQVGAGRLGANVRRLGLYSQTLGAREPEVGNGGSNTRSPDLPTAPDFGNPYGGSANVAWAARRPETALQERPKGGRPNFRLRGKIAIWGGARAEPC